MTHYIAGWLKDRATAERVIADLESAGFDRSRLGTLLASPTTTARASQELPGHDELQGDASRSAAVGGAGGAAGGAMTGWTISGMYPIFHQRELENHLREGNVLVLVEPDGRKEEIERLFSTYAAANIQDVELSPQDIEKLHNPQDTAAVADHTLETPAQGLANSKAYLAAHPEVAERLWSDERDPSETTPNP